jgi:hypothetical protein
MTWSNEFALIGALDDVLAAQAGRPGSGLRYARLTHRSPAFRPGLSKNPRAMQITVHYHTSISATSAPHGRRLIKNATTAVPAAESAIVAR